MSRTKFAAIRFADTPVSLDSVAVSMAALAEEILAEAMARLDIDADAIEIEGKVHRRVLRRTLSLRASGLVEAACKTLVAQRLKQSGMRRRASHYEAGSAPFVELAGRAVTGCKS